MSNIHHLRMRLLPYVTSTSSTFLYSDFCSHTPEMYSRLFFTRVGIRIFPILHVTARTIIDAPHQRSYPLPDDLILRDWDEIKPYVCAMGHLPSSCRPPPADHLHGSASCCGPDLALSQPPRPSFCCGLPLPWPHTVGERAPRPGICKPS